ncbi:MAG: DUF455 family protein [Micavibrio sp.]|nr:MAG: DUF455 family protein [Micavibrio sp.]
MLSNTLAGAALTVLKTADPQNKAQKTRRIAASWRDGTIAEIGRALPPVRPARPEKPELRPPKDMPKRRKAGNRENKTALLHALAHIELNAIDLAWDIIARFAPLAEENGGEDGYALPRAFFEDWLKVADDEAKHFLLLSTRLSDWNAAYGDLPAHDGLWDAAEKTAHDFAARLAVVPMVLEARGLDVTPAMIEKMHAQDDGKTAEILEVIYKDEITHVEAGTVWFKHWCAHHGKDEERYFQELVRRYFRGPLKKPFNDPARIEAGMIPDWYYPLS